MPRPVTTPLHLLCLLLVTALLGGCATTPGRTTTEDQWEGMNRSIYKFNDAVDRTTLKPLAKGYRAVTPQWVRTGVANFFANLETPWDVANQLLQGKPGIAAQDTCRFVFNTIVGVGGLFDVASKFELNAHDEDFGQTMAVWGVPSGPYVMLPFVGPSTVRDGFAEATDFVSAPLRYMDVPWEWEAGLWTLELVSWREEFLDTEATLDQAYDKYGVIRDAWLQRRGYMIYDGNPPEVALEDDVEMEEDSPEDAAPDDESAAPTEPPAAP